MQKIKRKMVATAASFRTNELLFLIEANIIWNLSWKSLESGIQEMQMLNINWSRRKEN